MDGGLQFRKLKSWIIVGQLYVLLGAFASIHWQVHGLFGERGLLPVAPQLECGEESIFECRLPFLRIVCSVLQLSPAVGLQFLALMGVLLSTVALLSRKFQNMITFFVLYFMYRTIYEAGGVFMYYQWDALLLESTVYVGILAWFGDGPVDLVSMFMISCLFVRVTFMNSVTKLLSKCPEWWNLTALNYHFQAQPLPTSLAWYFHHFLPAKFRESLILFTFFVEIFLIPLSLTRFYQTRKIIFFCQILIATVNILTGNLGTFTYNTIVLSLSLLIAPAETKLEKGISAFVIFRALYCVFVSNWGLFSSSKNLTFETARRILVDYIEFSCFCVIFMFVLTMLILFWRLYRRGSIGRNKKHLAFVTSISVIFVFFGTIPLLNLDEQLSQRTTGIGHIKQYHKLANSWGLLNSYGSFRQMTGKHGRPEIVIEGAHEIGGPWKEFEFIGKPGKLSKRPIILAPHQPRLDYQMYHAAEGTYQQNPFFLSLVHHLMENTTEVVNLLEDYPFKNRTESVEFVRAKLYMYHYTDDLKANDYWTRDFMEEYMPAFNRGNEALLTYLREHNIISKRRTKFVNGKFGRQLKQFNRYTAKQDQLTMIFTMLFAIIIMRMFFTRGELSHY